MKKKLTDLELLARDEAKVAARRAKIEARNARKDSKLVRKLETLLRGIDVLDPVTATENAACTAMRNVVEARLADARKAALNGET